MLVILIIVVLTFLLFLGFVYFRAVLGGNRRKLKEGMRLEQSGKLFEAISIYEFLLQEGYLTAELRWKIANLSMKLNNYPRAIKELSVLVETGRLPESIPLIALKSAMVDCYIKLGQIKDAFFLLVDLMKQAPDNTLLLFELAKIYASQKKTVRAIQLMEKCLHRNPNDPEMNYFMAKAAMDNGDPVNALKYLEKTARLRFYDNGRVNYFLGILYYANKSYNQALQHFTQVLKLRPNDNRLLSESHNYIALCYKEKGLVDEAITNFEKSQIYSELLPKDAQSKKNLYNQGVLLYKNGQYKKALDRFYKVKMLDYRYKDVEKIIKILTSKLRTGGKLSENIANYISDNPLSAILKRGYLYSSTRFNIDLVEQKAKKYSSALEGNVDSGPNARDTLSNYYSINDFNNMPSKQFKELARKMVNVIGFKAKSEPKFMGDDEYLDGNAINFLAISLKDSKGKNDILITIRRHRDTVPELSVSRFLDWMEEREIRQGIYLASSSFSNQALKVIQTAPHVRFIDKAGLSRVLGRIR